MASRFHFSAVLLVGALLLTGVGCKHEGDHDSMSMKSMEGKSLYERLGGEPAIRAVVDDLTARAAADPRVNFVRKGHPNTWDPSADDNMRHFKEHLVQFISMATGGPSKYEGKPIRDVHSGMEISEAEWTAFAEDLKATLNKLNVPEPEQAELFKIIGTTHGDVVGH